MFIDLFEVYYFLLRKKKLMIIDSIILVCKICYGLVLDMIVIIFVMLILIFVIIMRVLIFRCEEMWFYLYLYGYLINNNSEVFFIGEDNLCGKVIIKCFNYCCGD